MVKEYTQSPDFVVNPNFENDPMILAKDSKLDSFLTMRFGLESSKLRDARNLKQKTEVLINILKDGK